VDRMATVSPSRRDRMSSIAHARPSLAPPREPAPDRTALHAAVPADTRSLRARLRHPFTRRAPTVASLIRKHRLWPALEFVHDELVHEFESVRIGMQVAGLEERFPYVWMDVRIPESEADVLIDREDGLREQIVQRFGYDAALRLSATVNPGLSPAHWTSPAGFGSGIAD
jgi:hypothetical protein